MARTDHQPDPGPVDVAPTAGGSSGLRPYRPGRDLQASLDAVRRFLRAAVTRTLNGEGGLAELTTMVEIVDDVLAAIDVMVVQLLEHDDASFREISIALGITQQAAAKRYHGRSQRRPGGQPANLR
jgi:hypothetical protein